MSPKIRWIIHTFTGRPNSGGWAPVGVHVVNTLTGMQFHATCGPVNNMHAAAHYLPGGLSACLKYETEDVPAKRFGFLFKGTKYLSGDSIHETAREMVARTVPADELYTHAAKELVQTMAAYEAVADSDEALNKESARAFLTEHTTPEDIAPLKESTDTYAKRVLGAVLRRAGYVVTFGAPGEGFTLKKDGQEVAADMLPDPFAQVAWHLELLTT